MCHSALSLIELNNQPKMHWLAGQATATGKTSPKSGPLTVFQLLGDLQKS